MISPFPGRVLPHPCLTAGVMKCNNSKSLIFMKKKLL